MKKRYAVIMAGGSGTRFWPKSSKKNPKQFLKLVGKKSMIQMTFDRLRGVVPASQISVICAPEFNSLTKKNLKKIKIISEPEPRNTMAAVCLSVWTIAQKDPEATLCLLPADAYVENIKQYARVLNEAYKYASKEACIVCIGIKPTYAATAYGYVEVGPFFGNGIYKISRFVEKPTTERAQKFYSSGKYLWNAGIFVFKAGTFINEVKKHAPAYYSAFESVFAGKSSLKKVYSRLPKEPVDVALMEKTDKGVVCVGEFGWNDIGSWPALAEVLKSQTDAGLVLNKGGHKSVGSSGNIAFMDSKKFLGLIGVKDLIVVETEGALLVCAKDRAQDIKTLVEALSKDAKFKKLV